MSVLIDDRFYNFDGNNTIFQFCLKNGINLPCFCYHERLSIAGNCRICLVEANTTLVVSCAVNLMDHMVINTKSKRVRRSREGILEFLLVNHPLDCPICDQGGECDLQDIVINYGSDRGRFYEAAKRSVNNLNSCGPLIKTIMTRCIHCTRCVRFMQEVAGAFDLGIIGRGNGMEIGLYVEKMLSHELIGNIIDLCPVGALTSMPFSFTARPWELLGVRSIDILDSLASSIRLDVLNNKIMRVTPVLNENINEEWITNKIRYVYDSLSAQRMHYPKFNLLRKFIIVSWKSAIYLYLYNLHKHKLNQVQVFSGPFLDLETSLSLKGFFLSFGCNNFNYYENTSNALCDFRTFYFLGKTIKFFEHASNVVLLGSSPRFEVPLLNTRMRKSFLLLPLAKFYSFGLALDNSNYPVRNLGNSPSSLSKFIEGKFSLNFYVFFNDYLNLNFFNLNTVKKTYFLIGSSILSRLDANAYLGGFLNLFANLSFSLSYLNQISKFLGRLSAFEIGNLPGIKSANYKSSLKASNFLFLCGIDCDAIKYISKPTNFITYQGSFYINNFTSWLNLILPSCAFTEKFSSFLNLEGRLRFTQKAISPFKSVFLDWKILQVLGLIKKHLFSYNFSNVYKFYITFGFFYNVINYFCYFFYFLDTLLLAALSSISKNFYDYNFNNLAILRKFTNFKLINIAFSKTIINYYATDIFTKNSKILSICASKLPFSTFSAFFGSFS